MDIVKRIYLIFILASISLAACGQTGKQSTPTVALTTPTIRPTVTEALPTQTVAPSTPPAAQLQRVPGNYLFAEGPVSNANGNVFFSDINAGKIYRWSPDGQVALFKEGLKGPNGLAFDDHGNLIACEGGNGRLISLDMQGKITILADQYQGVRFNEPNDLWIDPQGGIYFTDPAYQSPVVQGGEDVYYLSPDRSQVSRVIADLVRPNGIVGSPDGKMLYVADHGARQTFAYAIASAGKLKDKRLLISSGSDGMDLDAAGNLFLTTPNQIQVYDTAGNRLRAIPIPENPTNVAFVGKEGKTLFITTRTSAYTLQLGATGASASMPDATFASPADFTLTSPEVSDDGTLPVEYTCDGASSTLALTWSGEPAGTRSYAVIMHHVASPIDIHWYWVVYDIPAATTSLPKNMSGIGTLGTNSVNGRQAYSPPCSKGPGSKTYTYTVYALSAPPPLSLSAPKVTRAVLLEAIQNITLASAELNVTYARP